MTQINQLVDWRPIYNLLNKNCLKQATTPMGAPSYPPLLLFKILLLETWYGLSDREVEELINDSISWGDFLYPIKKCDSYLQKMDRTLSTIQHIIQRSRERKLSLLLLLKWIIAGLTHYNKKVAFNNYSTEEIRRVQKPLNNRPRKKLNLLTPGQLFLSKAR